MEKVIFKVELKDGKWMVNDKPFAELDYTEKLMLQEFLHYARTNYEEQIPQRTISTETSFESKN